MQYNQEESQYNKMLRYNNNIFSEQFFLPCVLHYENDLMSLPLQGESLLNPQRHFILFVL